MDDEAAMTTAVEAAEAVRGTTSPNPWVGAVVVAGARAFVGATEPPGGRHAEVAALQAAGDAARGATLYVTLEPCCHQGRTPPCTDAIIASGIARVVVAVGDPDPNVAGGGITALERAGVAVETGLMADTVSRQLSAYLKHRRTGRPFVTLKLAATMDGRTAAPDGSSRWITGTEARADVHLLRSRSDAVMVGAGTVRADDPELTVRTVEARHQPRRVVLGRAPAGARVHPATELEGDLEEALDELGRQGVLSLLVEGGARVAHSLHRRGLVDRYVLYLAPALMGGSDGRPLFDGPGAASMDDVWRGRLVSVEQLGSDIRVELEPEAGRAA
ncbi:MAG TPA: bifunctional diaminohydroxyphosphoribosylaminopyrimidine deaminase/5-amino-6-(5-phosphoribosylamino)uracil reductase RibD [Acidimicrobiales bacterium]|nr:bifunctional diaminohydroxyphosphoribosylaminopyrimidine deaminase/5-amino-6-(5-phosphoribosylamino)uracil reductase RibD [Acidimicrobiales bacterium]